MFAKVRNLIAHALDGLRETVLRLRDRVDPDDDRGDVPWRQHP